GGDVLMTRPFFSIGGGFIVADGEEQTQKSAADVPLPYPFASAAELLRMAGEKRLAIWELMLENESALRGREKAREEILHIWDVMQACIERGMTTEGILPGGLSVRRRASRLAARLRE